MAKRLAASGPTVTGRAQHVGPVTGHARVAVQRVCRAGLSVTALAAALTGTVVEDVTDGDGVAVLDRPVAAFVAAHRSGALTVVMGAVSAAGGPVVLAVVTAAGGVLLGMLWRSVTLTAMRGRARGPCHGGTWPPVLRSAGLPTVRLERDDHGNGYSSRGYRRRRRPA